MIRNTIQRLGRESRPSFVHRRIAVGREVLATNFHFGGNALNAERLARSVIIDLTAETEAMIASLPLNALFRQHRELGLGKLPQIRPVVLDPFRGGETDGPSASQILQRTFEEGVGRGSTRLFLGDRRDNEPDLLEVRTLSGDHAVEVGWEMTLVRGRPVGLDGAIVSYSHRNALVAVGVQFPAGSPLEKSPFIEWYHGLINVIFSGSY